MSVRLFIFDRHCEQTLGSLLTTIASHYELLDTTRHSMQYMQSLGGADSLYTTGLF